MSILCLVWVLSILPNRKSLHPPQKLCHSNSATPQFVSKTFRAMKYAYFFIKIRNHIFSGTGAHNYNYFLNSLPHLNGELAYRLTKSIFTITMMKWILMLCNLCKTSYNVLIHSHVIVLELKFWGEFRFPGFSICKCGLLEWTIFFKRTNLHTTAFGDLRCFGCVFTFE